MKKREVEIVILSRIIFFKDSEWNWNRAFESKSW